MKNKSHDAWYWATVCLTLPCIEKACRIGRRDKIILHAEVFNRRVGLLRVAMITQKLKTGHWSNFKGDECIAVNHHHCDLCPGS